MRRILVVTLLVLGTTLLAESIPPVLPTLPPNPFIKSNEPDKYPCPSAVEAVKPTPEQLERWLLV